MNKNLQINSGSITLTINNDPDRVIEFNPNDVVFVERFYDIMQDFQKRSDEYKGRMIVLEKQKSSSVSNLKERLSIAIEIFDYMTKKIDEIFGDGTSKTLFGSSKNLDVLVQFFEGILPVIEEVRSEKLSKYGSKTSRVME